MSGAKFFGSALRMSNGFFCQYSSRNCCALILPSNGSGKEGGAEVTSDVAADVACKVFKKLFQKGV